MRNEKALKAQGHANMVIARVVCWRWRIPCLSRCIRRGSGGARSPRHGRWWAYSSTPPSVVAFVLVWRALNRLWTVKLLIASDHVLNQSTLFRWVRHPNYFLNIIPELCGLALIMGAWIVLVIGLPCYLLVLRVRIRRKNRCCTSTFPSTRRVRCHPVTRTPRLVIPPNGGVRSPGNPGMRVGLPCGVAVHACPLRCDTIGECAHACRDGRASSRVGGEGTQGISADSSTHRLSRPALWGTPQSARRESTR